MQQSQSKAALAGSPPKSFSIHPSIKPHPEVKAAVQLWLIPTYQRVSDVAQTHYTGEEIVQSRHLVQPACLHEATQAPTEHAHCTKKGPGAELYQGRCIDIR